MRAVIVDSVNVQVARDHSGAMLDVRSEAELARRPWAAGDRATFDVKAEEWTAAEYDEHRGPTAVQSAALVDATIEELIAEARRRGYDPRRILEQLLLGGDI